MNRFSLMTYSAVTFFIMFFVVVVNFWVGREIRDPAVIPAAAVSKPIPQSADKNSGPRPPFIDPKNDLLAPIVVHAPVEKPQLEDTNNPPKKYYEPAVETGDVLAM